MRALTTCSTSNGRLGSQKNMQLPSSKLPDNPKTMTNTHQDHEHHNILVYPHHMASQRTFMSALCIARSPETFSSTAACSSRSWISIISSYIQQCTEGCQCSVSVKPLFQCIRPVAWLDINIKVHDQGGLQYRIWYC